MNSRGSFFSVYSRFNSRASVSLGLVPELTTTLFSFKCTVHARGGPKSIAQTQPYITLPLPHRPNLQSQTGHNKNIQTRKGHETPSAKCYKFFHSCFLLFHEGKTSEERGEKRGMYVVNYSRTWWKWLCFKCWGERRETAVKHIWSIFHFQGSDCLPKGTTTHKHTRRTIEIGLFSLLYSFF